MLQQTRSSVRTHLGDDFNTAQATNAVRKLISATYKEMEKPTRKFVTGEGRAITMISNFVSDYFTSLGITSLVSNGFKLNDVDVYIYCI